jgi:hypothetical protein
MLSLAELAMAKKLNWERNLINRKARFGLSVKDESEFRKTDTAARWLARRERQRQQTKPAKQAQLVAQQRKPIHHRRRPATSFEQLNNDDPHHQLVGVNMSKPPW